MSPFQPTVDRRLFEIHAHHHDEIGGKVPLHRGEVRRVVDGGVVIVDRAGSDDDEQAVVGAMQDAMDGLSRFVRGGGRPLACRKLAKQVCRGGEFLDLPDPRVVDPEGGGTWRRGGAVTVGSRRRQGGLRNAKQV